MNGGWFDQDERVMSEINITPLVDVSLVLLIIFMITAPMMVQGADVQLPRTRPMETLPQSELIVSITAQGDVLINGQTVPRGDFEARISPMITPGRRVLLHGDAAAAYGRVMEVMAVLHELGAEIGAVTEPIPERRR